ncbi:MAG: methyl-accepting chemotaxis protein [Phenylobacterium sp.]|jgi:methyl-accepting chemotaxis protein
MTKVKKNNSKLQITPVVMPTISASSKQIRDIIGVIDEIAFQTNLLALNAAVEAARAGEQGRGFAVVASEVRNLAGRSSNAAKEIKELINSSEVNVTKGVELVNQSGIALAQIVSAVKEVNTIITDVDNGTQLQTSGIGQVNKAIVQMDKMTQQNAALVEQVMAASNSMAGQAQSVSDSLDFFTTDDSVIKKSNGPRLPKLPRLPKK